MAAAQAHLVSLLSVFNCLGRLASGFVSDFFLHQAPLHLRCARVWWLGTISMKGKDRCHFTHRCSICSADFGPLCPFASAGELDRRGRLYRPQLSAKFAEVSPGRRMVRLNTADCRDWVSSTRLISVRNESDGDPPRQVLVRATAHVSQNVTHTLSSKIRSDVRSAPRIVHRVVSTPHFGRPSRLEF